MQTGIRSAGGRVGDSTQAGEAASERTVSFFAIEPEASGSPASGLPASRIACVFDTWLGDDLVRAHPAVLVTTPVKRALLRLQRPSGFEITRARVRTSVFFRKHSPGKRLPPFWAIHVQGHAGLDDMGLTPVGILVVSRRVLDLLMDFRIGRAVMRQYTPAEPPANHRTNKLTKPTKPWTGKR